MPSTGAWVKMITSSAVLCIGGPALIWKITPTEDEIVEKYNPELKKRALEGRYQRQADFDDFVTRLKVYSKSDKPIWVVEKEPAWQKKADAAVKANQEKRVADEIERQRREMRAEATRQEVS